VLKGIANIISPELLKVLMEMGHGDEIVIADGNFPAASHAARLIRCDGHGAIPLLEAILPLFPLDQYVQAPVALMSVVPGDPTKPEIWTEYKRVLEKYETSHTQFEFVERYAFYDRAKEAYAIVATGEPALYANIILKKGVIRPSL
jgi:L-fucose mutarotase